MATINKKLVHFNLRTEFEKRKAAGDILESSICWIKDAKLIYTHGTYYDCSTLDLSSYVTTTALVSALEPYALSSNLATVATSGSYNDLSNKPAIPSAVTESTVSGWGFTKNTGTYSKPSSGIPKTDLASAVQTSLGKADTALQSFTETDPVFQASAAAGITYSDITNWNSKTSNTGTITEIKMNGASKGASGVVDLGNILIGDGTITKIVYVSALPSNPDATTLYLIP